MDSRRKHDSICDLVADELMSRGWSTSTNIEYKKGKKTIGEIDVLAYKDDYVIAVEVKCNLRYKNKKKAIEQLKRANEKFSLLKKYRSFTLIAHEQKQEIKYKFVPNFKVYYQEQQYLNMIKSNQPKR